MDEIRANPDEILHRIKKESNIESRGHLKIFFGMRRRRRNLTRCSKTAHRGQNDRGVGVSSSAYVEPHTRPQTLALLDGLEQLPTLTVSHKGDLPRMNSIWMARSNAHRSSSWLTSLPTPTPRAAATASAIRMWRSCCGPASTVYTR